MISVGALHLCPRCASRVPTLDCGRVALCYRGSRGRPDAARDRSWKAWLVPFFEEVYGTYPEHVGHLLASVGTAAALVLQPPHRSRRKPGSLGQLALREPPVDPQLLKCRHVYLHGSVVYRNVPAYS